MKYFVLTPQAVYDDPSLEAKRRFLRFEYKQDCFTDLAALVAASPEHSNLIKHWVSMENPFLILNEKIVVRENDDLLTIWRRLESGTWEPVVSIPADQASSWQPKLEGLYFVTRVLSRFQAESQIKKVPL